MPYYATGYHTCTPQGGPIYISQHAPFLAKTATFLSIGYYFWQSREHDAHEWGQRQRSRYSNGYVICKCDLELQCLLDLEHPDDTDHLAALEHEMIDCGRIKAALSVSELIQYLRDLDDPDIFPFDSVRMRQEPAREKREQRVYNAAQPAKMLTWNAQFIICTFTKKKPIVNSCQIVYPEHYARSRR